MALAGNLFNLGVGNGSPPPALGIRAENYPLEGTPEGMSPMVFLERQRNNGNNRNNNNFQGLPRRNYNDPIEINVNVENATVDPEVIAENAQEGGRRRRYRKKTRKTRKTKKSRKSRKSRR